jgi:imidazolonepropionase-like amidohydrolase
MAGYRAAWIRAAEYRRKTDSEARQGTASAAARGGAAGLAPGGPAGGTTRDLELETLAEVLRGEILVHNHCYRGDEMAQMIDLAREFGYRIRSFHHGVEAYKVRDLMARDSISGSLWADWGGFKLEALDFTRANVAMVHQAGGIAVVHSDDPTGIQKLNQEAAKALQAGRAAGLQVSENDALRWITYNAAWALGIHDRVGTLEAGKNADVVVWSHNPFSVYARADQVFIDGALMYDRMNRAASRGPTSRWALPGGGRTMNRILISAAALCFAASGAAAQTVAIVGGDVYMADGTPIRGGTVVIQNGRIAAVGANVAIPAGARRIDARGSG